MAEQASIHPFIMSGHNFSHHDLLTKVTLHIDFPFSFFSYLLLHDFPLLT